MTALSLASSALGLRHVFVRDLILPARIGVHPHEHTSPQRVRINVDLAVHEEPSPPPGTILTVREELERVVDYETITNQVRAIVAERHVRLVETLAERIAESCLLDKRVVSARIRVEKLDVFPDAASAGVEIERSQGHLSTTSRNREVTRS
ncbi:MAG: dihydroneopterin aldolase [Acetobacteraceae bacterium]